MPESCATSTSPRIRAHAPRATQARRVPLRGSSGTPSVRGSAGRNGPMTERDRIGRPEDVLAMCETRRRHGMAAPRSIRPQRSRYLFATPPTRTRRTADMQAVGPASNRRWTHRPSARVGRRRGPVSVARVDARCAARSRCCLDLDRGPCRSRLPIRKAVRDDARRSGYSSRRIASDQCGLQEMRLRRSRSQESGLRESACENAGCGIGFAKDWLCEDRVCETWGLRNSGFADTRFPSSIVQVGDHPSGGQETRHATRVVMRNVHAACPRIPGRVDNPEQCFMGLRQDGISCSRSARSVLKT